MLGVALLVAVVGSAAFGGVGLRRQLLPSWSGAVARLAETVIALGIVLGVAEVLGAVGLFRAPLVVAGCILAGVILGVASLPRLGASAWRPLAPSVAPLALAIALAGAVLVFAQWTAGVEQAFKGGMVDPDTLSYHGPIAARFVQQASIVHPEWVYSDPAVGFYPATSELFHALGILLFSRDVMSPFINVAWLALALLAAWCVGRPRGIGPAALLAVAVLLDLPVLSSSQPGSDVNDMIGLALLLSSMALLFNSIPATATDESGAISGAAVALAGGAAGLAVSTKLTMLAPVALLTVAVLVIIPGARCRLAWILALVGGSVIWFARNAIAFGNPIPELHLGIGPVALSSPKFPASYSVADYLTNGRIWESVFLPSLHGAFGVIWPVLLALALLGVILGALYGPTRLDRALAVVAVLAALAYIWTPRTAFGEKGFPVFFAANTRYLLPALLIGVVLLVRAVPVSGLVRNTWGLAVLGAGLIVDLVHSGQTVLVVPVTGPTSVIGPTPHFLGATAMWVGLAIAAAFAWWASVGNRAIVPSHVALIALAALALLAWPAERSYLHKRYTTGPLAFARSLHHQRIAIAGFLEPYPAYGLDLSNTVVELANVGADGLRKPIDSCREWLTALAAGHYDYVVTSQPLYRSIWYPTVPDGAAWTRADPSATELSATPDFVGGTISVFRIHGRIDPDSCERRSIAGSSQR